MTYLTYLGLGIKGRSSLRSSIVQINNLEKIVLSKN